MVEDCLSKEDEKARLIIEVTKLQKEMEGKFKELSKNLELEKVKNTKL